MTSRSRSKAPELGLPEEVTAIPGWDKIIKYVPLDDINMLATNTPTKFNDVTADQYYAVQGSDKKYYIIPNKLVKGKFGMLFQRGDGTGFTLPDNVDLYRLTQDVNVTSPVAGFTLPDNVDLHRLKQYVNVTSPVAGWDDLPFIKVSPQKIIKKQLPVASLNKNKYYAVLHNTLYYAIPYLYNSKGIFARDDGSGFVLPYNTKYYEVIDGYASILTSLNLAASALEEVRKHNKDDARLQELIHKQDNSINNTDVSTMLNILMQNLENNYSDNSLLQVWGDVQILYNMQNSKQDGGKRKPLTECTVVELKAKARTRNIKGFSCMRKAELVSALRRK